MSGRAGLSDYTATVLLIVITLVAGATLYAYFTQGPSPSVQSAASAAESVVNSIGSNQIGNFENEARVSANVVSCDNADGACVIELTNSGTMNTDVEGCSFSSAGASQGSLSPTGVEVPSGGSTQVTCTEPSSQGTGSGAQVAGSILLSNGATVPWSGTWQ
ncbi:MAG TPA: archaellin/type IV pilin N-terminal domain-containing protein [Nitrososphaerales archaeon]|nr:archaellin/type IV pilin N-terminal domain-containing protein [Nitrososphaerales archaeon]